MLNMDDLIKIRNYTKPKYEFVDGLYDNRALVSMKKDENPFSSFLHGYIDADGNEVIPCKYYTANRFSEGLACVRRDGHNCVIDPNDNIVLHLKDYEVSAVNAYFSNGLLLVRNPKTDKWGYIDKKGKEVIPCVYESACNFSEGLALVFKENTKSKNISNHHADSCYIDTNGKEQIFPNEIYGFNALSLFSNGIVGVLNRTTGETMYINKEGKIVEKDIGKANELYDLEREKTTIKDDVMKNLVIYCSDISFGGENFIFKEFKQEALSEKKLALLSLIKSRLELEMQNIDKEETITSTHKSSK